MKYATRGQFDGLGLKTIGRTVSGFGTQNLDGGSEEERGDTWWNHKGCIEAKQICAGSVAVRSIGIGLDHNALRIDGSS
jgi:hypothetical protein